jgi:adenosylcobyric acid synthase
MIQGTASSAGKTTLVTALCRIFVEKGFSVAPFKAQNMSNYAYKGKDFEISRAQAVQALASRIEISADLNPILLKPLGDYRSSVFLRGKFYKKMHADDYYSNFVRKNGMKIVLKSFHALEKNYDLIIIEGAGSPAEINLTKYDIANMKLAEKTKSPVILITDIERGGSFGSIVGTISLLEKKYQKMIKGFVFNRFRGDLDILKPGFRKLKQNTGKSVFGTIPLTKFLLPEEDSITSNSKQIALNSKNLQKIDSEIEKLSKVVKSSLNIRVIEKLL